MAKTGYRDLTENKSGNPPYFIGTDISAKIYKQLNEEEIEQLTLEISNIKKWIQK